MKVAEALPVAAMLPVEVDSTVAEVSTAVAGMAGIAKRPR